MARQSTPYHQQAPHWKVRETTEYKLLRRGTMAVSDLELLSVITGSKTTARKLLTAFGSLRSLFQANVKELMNAGDLSRKAALTLVSAGELARRKAFEQSQLIRITSSQAVAEYISPRYEDYKREVFYVIFVNRNNEILAEEELFTGGVCTVTIDPKYVFNKAIGYLASAIVLIHNHPTGNTQPSQADRSITAKLVQAGDLLGISVLDHIIISNLGYYSFADEGVLI